MSGHDHDSWAALDHQGRPRLTLEEVAGRLDHRLHWPDIGIAQLKAGCQLAIDQHLAAIICRPEHVAHAAAHLAGSEVGVVSGVDFSRPSVATDEAVWLEQARALAGAGATELAVTASAARLGQDPPGCFQGAVERLLALQEPYAFRLRVHVDPRGLTDEQIVVACRQFAEAGVWMVQSGSWQAERAGFRSVVLMREALGTRVLLKWTTTVRSLHVMLLGIAEGVDRFNADVVQVLQEGARQASLATLLVPKPGLDY